MKPSWAVTKLTDAIVPRPRVSKRSCEPASRVASSLRRRASRRRAADARTSVSQNVRTRVAEAVVPLREGRREVTGAPAVDPDVPGLGDELVPREHRVGAQRDEERVVGVVGVVLAAAEGHGEVEAEAVDVALLHPVAQRVEHHPRHDRGG